MKAIKFSNKSNIEKLKLLHPIGKTPSKVFESAWQPFVLKCTSEIKILL